MTFRAFCPVLSVVLLVTVAVGIVNAQTRPTLLVDVDHRATLSLDGDWHIIVDPNASGIYDFHQKVKKDGYFMNSQPQQDGRLIEYNFANSEAGANEEAKTVARPNAVINP